MKYLKPLGLFHELLKSNVITSGRLLGVDIGDKYLGLAVSSDDNRIASPLCVLVRNKSNMDLIAGDLECLAAEFSLAGFVFGIPRCRDRNSVDGGHVKVFADELGKTGKLEDIKYTFWEECFTSKNIDFLLKPFSFSPVQSKTITDKLAAVQILQGYLDFVNKTKQKSKLVLQGDLVS